MYASAGSPQQRFRWGSSALAEVPSVGTHPRPGSSSLAPRPRPFPSPPLLPEPLLPPGGRRPPRARALPVPHPLVVGPEEVGNSLSGLQPSFSAFQTVSYTAHCKSRVPSPSTKASAHTQKKNHQKSSENPDKVKKIPQGKQQSCLPLQGLESRRILSWIRKTQSRHQETVWAGDRTGLRFKTD